MRGEDCWLGESVFVGVEWGLVAAVFMLSIAIRLHYA
jgi:hypothetical protein